MCPIPCEARLRGTASAAIYYHSVGGSVWLCQLDGYPDLGSCPGMGPDLGVCPGMGTRTWGRAYLLGGEEEEVR